VLAAAAPSPTVTVVIVIIILIIIVTVEAMMEEEVGVTFLTCVTYSPKNA